ncbi:hypothetical protein EGR_10446 [Echinococcus granulosus]|uniref:Uncharacterized protein n=1 Tax=Echinococcus granulosus TaxID=6210 RepID=W6UMG7_ECHGR|nr:hypothetical protein EGR_10446 [Echinococcus granulosus]EUB54684.1 hypothetical protein EGR_10446 [Echinococcus granulosus]
MPEVTPPPVSFLANGSGPSRGILRNRDCLDARCSLPRCDASLMSAMDRSPASMAPNSNAMNAEAICK